MEIHQFIQRINNATLPITATELKEIEEFTARYPWCGIIHQLLLEVYHLNHSEQAKTYMPVAAIYALNRTRLYQRLQQCKTQKNAPTVPSATSNENEDDCEENYITLLPNNEEDKPAEPTSRPPAPLTSPGEYFSTSDLAEINPGNDPLSQFIIEKPKINIPSNSSIKINKKDPPENNEQCIDYKKIVTETLAEIYVSQGLFSLAIDTYEKLSLLIPEKNAYFADKIQNLKTKSKF